MRVYNNFWTCFILGMLCLLHIKSVGQGRVISNFNQNGFSRHFDTSSNTLYVNHNGKVMSYDSRGLFYFAKYLPGDMWKLAKSPLQKKTWKVLDWF